MAQIFIINHKKYLRESFDIYFLVQYFKNILENILIFDNKK